MQMIFGSSAAPIIVQDSLNLSGTLESPETVTKLFAFSGFANAEWNVGCVQVPLNSIEKGEVQSAGWANIQTPIYASNNPSTAWIIPHDFDVNYYIRATLEVGIDPDLSSGMDVWLSLVPEGSNRAWRWSRGTEGTNAGTIKLEIASDSEGEDIVTTGYYRGVATKISI